jgi:hypothetical protein
MGALGSLTGNKAGDNSVNACFPSLKEAVVLGASVAEHLPSMQEALGSTPSAVCGGNRATGPGRPQP